MARGGRLVVWEPDSAYSTQFCPITWKITRSTGSVTVCVFGEGGEGRKRHKGLQSVWKQVKHSANRGFALHPAHLPGWQQSVKQVVVPVLAYLSPLGWVWSWLWVTRQGALAPVLCSTVPVACPWLERTFCVCGCACKMDAAGGAFAYSVQNKCLVNRYSLSNRKGHGHFPLPPLCHDVLPFQAAFSGFQQAEQLAAVRAAPSIRAAARTCPCSHLTAKLLVVQTADAQSGRYCCVWFLYL